MTRENQHYSYVLKDGLCKTACQVGGLARNLTEILQYSVGFLTRKPMNINLTREKWWIDDCRLLRNSKKALFLYAASPMASKMDARQFRESHSMKGLIYCSLTVKQ
jgi:hypothetical protein